MLGIICCKSTSAAFMESSYLKAHWVCMVVAQHLPCLGKSEVFSAAYWCRSTFSAAFVDGLLEYPWVHLLGCHLVKSIRTVKLYKENEENAPDARFKAFLLFIALTISPWILGHVLCTATTLH